MKSIGKENVSDKQIAISAMKIPKNQKRKIFKNVKNKTKKNSPHNNDSVYWK